MPEPTKVCSKCHNEWPPSGFYAQKRAKDGLSSHCRACVSAYQAERKAKDPERVAAINREAAYRHRAKTGDARNKAVSRARHQALQRLADVCPAEFAAVYDSVLREHGLELQR
jgi:hypothetical protein